MKKLRYALVWASLMAAGSAVAQELPAPTWIEFVSGENISFSEATWELFTQVAESKRGSEPSVVEELPGRLRLDDKRHLAFFAQIKAAVNESRTHATSLRSAMCKQRAEFTTIERVAAELERIDEEVVNRRDKLMAATAPILGLDGTARLEGVVMEIRGRMSLPRINYVEAMRERKETVPAVMTRLCSEFDTRR